MKQRVQQTRLGKSYKTFLESSNFMKKFNALLYFFQFQVSIKLLASLLNIVKLHCKTKAARDIACGFLGHPTNRILAT